MAVIPVYVNVSPLNDSNCVKEELVYKPEDLDHEEWLKRATVRTFNGRDVPALTANCSACSVSM